MTTPIERRRRIARSIGYLFFAITGIWSMIWPPPTVQDAIGRSFLSRAIYLWAALWLVGGVMSAWGAFWHKWPGEYIGLLGLIAVLWVYAGAVALFAISTGRSSTAAGTFIFAGAGCILLCRWIKANTYRQEAEQAKRQSDETDMPGSGD